MLSRPEAGEPAGARGQFGGFLSRRTEMAVSACGAPVGGSARESNSAPKKGTLGAPTAAINAERNAGRAPPCADISRSRFGRIVGDLGIEMPG